MRRARRWLHQFQLVWWPGEWYFGFTRPDGDSSWSGIFRWFLWLGPLEVRRWRTARPERRVLKKGMS